MGALQYNQLATLASTGSKTTWGGNGGNDHRQQRRNSRNEPTFDRIYTLLTLVPAHPASDNVHQTGTSYSSNSAGDGPEKTRDRKSWFPRFKSNWLGTFRSKQMFLCCECAVPPSSGGSLSSQAIRYKGAEGKHCRCGKDQWHLAKSVEETEYNRRMAISKALGGMRYDEAVQRLRNTDQSKLDYKPTELINTGLPTQSQNTRELAPISASPSSMGSPKRSRSASSSQLPTRMYATSHVIKPDFPAMPLPSSQIYGDVNLSKQYGAYIPVYSNNGIECMQPQQHHQHPAEYEHLTPPAFGDEESFGDLLEGILEDDPRVAAATSMGLSLNHANGYGGARCGYVIDGPQGNCSVVPLKRAVSMPAYATTPSMASPSRAIQDYHNLKCRPSLNPAPAFLNYQHNAPQQQPMLQHQYPYQPQQHYQSQQQIYTRPLSMTPSAMATATSTSFSK